MSVFPIGILAAAFLVAGLTAATATDATSGGTGSASTALQFEKLDGYTGAQTRVANRIAARFAAAGYGPAHQIAAISVAIRESSLNPAARNRGCSCYGLFQMNRSAGLGRGHSVADLTDIRYNIALIIKETRHVPGFAAATTVEQAVRSFVRHVTRPADKSAVVSATMRTARKVQEAADVGDTASLVD
jgi:hypothetical protein